MKFLLGLYWCFLAFSSVSLLFTITSSLCFHTRKFLQFYLSCCNFFVLAYYWTYSLASHSPFLFLWEFQGYWFLRNFLDFFHHFFFLELEFTQFLGFIHLLKEFPPHPFPEAVSWWPQPVPLMPSGSTGGLSSTLSVCPSNSLDFGGRLWERMIFLEATWTDKMGYSNFYHSLSSFWSTRSHLRTLAVSSTYNKPHPIGDHETSASAYTCNFLSFLVLGFFA